MTKTLVERLRMHAAFVGHPMPNQASMASEDADRIEKLERENQDAIEAAFAYKARIEKLEAALRPFADRSEQDDGSYDDSGSLVLVVNKGVFRTASAALKGE